MNGKKTKSKYVLYLYLFFCNLYSYSQVDTVCLELNWTDTNIKHLFGKIIVRDTLNNVFFGKKFVGETTFQNKINVQIPVNIKENTTSLNIEVKFIDFYPLKMYVDALKVNKIKCFLNEIPLCELKKIEKNKK